MNKNIPTVNWLLYIMSAVMSGLLTVALLINFLSHHLENFAYAFGSNVLARELDCIIINIFSIVMGLFMSARISLYDNENNEYDNEKQESKLILNQVYFNDI